jgi:hypothetical protein
MPPPTGTWKNLERWVAKFFGGERTHWALEDDRAGPFSFECKHGKQIPKTILKWWAQAETNAGKLSYRFECQYLSRNTTRKD